MINFIILSMPYRTPSFKWNASVSLVRRWDYSVYGYFPAVYQTVSEVSQT